MKQWKYITYIKKGLSHEQSGTECQDSVQIQENANWLVAALADGLGSLKYSDVAANAATEAICQQLLEEKATIFDNGSNAQLHQKIMKCVVSAVEKKTNLLGISKSQVDCTLVFVGIHKSSNRAIVGRLGDSAVCIIKEKDSIAINDSNKSANGTNAVLDQDASEHLDIQFHDIIKENILGFILSSDGLDNELYMKGSDHVRKATELYFNALCNDTSDEGATQIIADRIRKLTSMKDSPFDDDISLAIMSCADRKIDLPEDPTWLCSCGARNNLQNTYCHKCNQDFSILYQNIRFRDYGGKAAFFAQINKKPDEEKRIIGMSGRDSVKQAATIDDKKPKNAPETDKETVRVSAAFGGQTRNRSVEPAVKADQQMSRMSKHGEKDNGHNYAHIQDEWSIASGVGDKGKTTQQTMKQNNSSGEIVTHENKAKRISINPWLLICVGCILFGLIIGSTLTKRASTKQISKLTTEKTELSQQNQELESTLEETNRLLTEAQNQLTDAQNSLASIDNTTTRPAETSRDFTVLNDSRNYWGPINAEEPNGTGIMEVNGVYYIGRFDYGVKNGSFVVFDSNSNIPSIVLYDNDTIIQDSGKDVSDEENEVANEDTLDSSQKIISTIEEETPTISESEEKERDIGTSIDEGDEDNSSSLEYVIKVKTDIYEKPGAIGKHVVLKPGTKIHVLDITETVYGVEWVQVEMDGIRGWTYKAMLW